MRLLSRLTDAMLLACPYLISAIALAALPSASSLGNAMIAIGVATTPVFVRLTRGQVMVVKVEDFVEAARMVGNPPPGASRWCISCPTSCRQPRGAGSPFNRCRHHRRGRPLLPRPRPAAARSVLGQHAQRGAALLEQCALAGDLPRGVAIFVTVLAFNVLGDGLRDALDPRER